MALMFSRRFCALLLPTFLTACAVSDGARTLVLIPNPVAPILVQAEKLRIRGPNEPWTHFRADEVAISSDAANKFWGLCSDKSYNKSAILPIAGFRILDTKASESLPARGYLSPIDFYSAFRVVHQEAYSAVEAIEREIELENLPIFLEFKASDGLWRRSSLDELGRIVRVEISETTASHGIVFEQVPTGHEKNYTIFGVSISVIDLATKQTVAENIGFRRDLYWGAHNHYRLIPYEIRCGYPSEENYVGTWLSSLVRKPASGSKNPYNSFKPREVVANEDRHWSGKCSSPPPNERWPGHGSTVFGEIASFDKGVLKLIVMNHDAGGVTRIITERGDGTWEQNFHMVSVSVSSDTRIYTASGRPASPGDLLVGEDVAIWPENCGRSSSPPPEARYIGISTNAYHSKLKEKYK